MKVLAVSGSPRKDGNTEILLAEVMRGAASRGAETHTLFVRDIKISPCEHCDACLKTGRCKITDDMQAVYEALEAADRIVLASPIQFMSLTGQMKVMIDRCQSLWARKYILKQPPLTPRPGGRKGFFVSVGGTRVKDLFQPAIATVRAFFRVLDIEYTGELVFAGIDEKGAILQRPEALQQAFAAGINLVELSTPQVPRS